MPAVETFVFLAPLAKDDIQTFEKDPASEVKIAGVFKNRLTGNPYTLTGGAVTAVDSSGNDVSADLIGTVAVGTTDGTITVVLKDDVEEGKYLVYFDGISADFPKLRGAVRVKVKELKA
jgi:hypothetical protein